MRFVEAIETHGYSGFLAATITAKPVLVLMGCLRAGTYYLVTIGFTEAKATAEIAAVIGPEEKMQNPGAIGAPGGSGHYRRKG